MASRRASKHRGGRDAAGTRWRRGRALGTVAGNPVRRVTFGGAGRLIQVEAQCRCALRYGSRSPYGGPDGAPVDSQSGALAVRQSCGWRDKGRRCWPGANLRRPAAGRRRWAPSRGHTDGVAATERACGRGLPLDEAGEHRIVGPRRTGSVRGVRAHHGRTSGFAPQVPSVSRTALTQGQGAGHQSSP